MTNRYHLPVVVTTEDDMTREEAIDYVERVLANLEETESVYRTFVEDEGIDTNEAERLLEMMVRFDEEGLHAAMSAMEELEDEQNT